MRPLLKHKKWRQKPLKLALLPMNDKAPHRPSGAFMLCEFNALILLARFASPRRDAKLTFYQLLRFREFDYGHTRQASFFPGIT
jgi:hypothetical protein